MIYGRMIPIYIGFPDGSCSQLGILGTIVKDEYLFCHSAAKVKKTGQAGHQGKRVNRKNAALGNLYLTPSSHAKSW
jgi:hypothetical protein